MERATCVEAMGVKIKRQAFVRHRIPIILCLSNVLFMRPSFIRRLSAEGAKLESYNG